MDKDFIHNRILSDLLRDRSIPLIPVSAEEQKEYIKFAQSIVNTLNEMKEGRYPAKNRSIEMLIEELKDAKMKEIEKIVLGCVVTKPNINKIVECFGERLSKMGKTLTANYVINNFLDFAIKLRLNLR